MRPGSGKTPDSAPDGVAEALRLLGLARRAGRVALGVPAARQAIQKGAARLVVTAADGSEGQVRKVSRLARHRAVPWRKVESGAELARALGVSELSALAVTDAGFAEQILRRLPGTPRGDGEA